MIAVASSVQTLSFTRQIDAPLNQVWESWINRDNLSDWLCADAFFHGEPGTAFTLTWHGRDHRDVHGEVVAADPQHALELLWYDVDQSAPTYVGVQLSEGEGGITVQVTHRDLAEERADAYQAFWDAALDNLQSILETGANRRITGRVLVGFIPNLERAQDALPAGVAVEQIIEGGTAASAGLQVGDIITGVDGQPVTNLQSLGARMNGKQVGDPLTIEVNRAGESLSLPSHAMSYPIPYIPSSAADFATYEAQTYEEGNRALLDALSGVSEEKANGVAEGDPWSIRQHLAHLILMQRHKLEWLSTYHQGPRRINPFTREAARIAALLDSLPTVAALVEELQRCQRETLAIIRLFTPEFEARKNHLWWIGFESQYGRDTLRNTATAIRRLAAAL